MDSKENHRDAMMEVNNLSYRFDDPLSLSHGRTAKKQYFDTRSYTVPGASQAVSVWNSGADLIDTRNSYLKFNLTLAADGPSCDSSFGSGSAMNLINEIKVISASGLELSRTQFANVYHKFVVIPKRSPGYLYSTGALFGAQQEAKTMDRDIAYTFCIPLVELDPFFATYDMKLLPACVASGLRIEISFENLNTCFVNTGTDTLTSYTIDQIEFRCESVSLADSAVAILNKEASTNGLELTYDRVYGTTKPTGTSTDDVIEVRKAVSLAKAVHCLVIPTANINSQTADSFSADTYSFSKVQTRLGNNYYPFQPIETAEEAYFNYLRIFNKHKSVQESGITLAEFKTSKGSISATFETDDSLNLTGIPVNSSRIAEVLFTRNNATSVRTYAFLVYTALGRFSLSNASVKI